MDQLKAFKQSLALAAKLGMDKMHGLRPEHSYEHLVDMLKRAEIGVKTGTYSEAKLGRHLGWAQSSISSAGLGLNLNDFMEINKSCSEPGKKSIEEVLKSLVIDIEAMQALPGDPDVFGSFDYVAHDTQDEDWVYVKWPNLAILLQEAKKALGDGV